MCPKVWYSILENNIIPFQSIAAGGGKFWGRGGTGRRAGLKNLCPQGRVGSIPTIPILAIFSPSLATSYENC
jgi:hypothetical protein